MTGNALILAAACLMAVTACGGDATTGVEPMPATEIATTGEGATQEDGPLLGQEPDAPTAPDSKTDLVATPTPTPTPTPSDPASGDGPSAVAVGDDPAGFVDLSSVARPLDPPEGGFDEATILLEEDFQSTTPSIVPFETDDGLGGIGSLGDRRFFEMLVHQPEARVAAPIARLDAQASQQVYLQVVSFVSNFAGLTAADRGVYCWARNGNDPLSSSRYELLYTPQGQMQVIRFGEAGQPEALVIDETFDFEAANEADPDAPDAGDEATRIGLLCRPDAEGRAQVAVRVDRTYYVTTDAGGPPPGGGAGLIVAGRGSAASTDSIVTFDGIFVLDGGQVPLQ